MAKQKRLLAYLSNTGSMAAPIFREGGDGSGTFTIQRACAIAMAVLAEERKACTLSNEPLAIDYEKHPDSHVIRTWLDRGKHDPRDLQVIFWLAYFVRNEWADIPHHTPSQHRALYHRIAKLSRNLSDALGKA